jgi:hypothetical protein
MVNLVDELHAIAGALRALGVPYAICGGIAVTIHGATRTTKDIDVLIERRDAPRVLEAVRPLGYVFAALPMTFDAGTERERNVQRVSKLHDKEHMVLDLRSPRRLSRACSASGSRWICPKAYSRWYRGRCS